MSQEISKTAKRIIVEFHATFARLSASGVGAAEIGEAFVCYGQGVVEAAKNAKGERS